MNTYQEATNHTIKNAVEQIKNMIDCGWSKNEALELYKKNSSMGNKTWKLVLKKVQ